MNSKRSFLGMALISIFLLPAFAELGSATLGPIKYSEIDDMVTVRTDYINVKIVPDQGHLMWWVGHNNTDELYKLQLVKLQEFGGSDSVLDNKSEFLGMSYNLITEDWVYAIDEQEDQVDVTLSLVNFDGAGASLYLIMHASAQDVIIDGTNRTVQALQEVKFDIVVEGWTFSAQAQGYAIQTYLHEVRQRNRIRVRNGTNNEYGPNIRIMEFAQEGADDVLAYYEWTTFANIYNASDDLVDTIDVGTAYFEDLVDVPIEGSGEGLENLFLTYPKYSDGYTMIHDPLLGVNDYPIDGPNIWLTIVLPVSSGIVLLGLIATFVVIRKKK